MLDYSSIPLFALSEQTKQLISILLNPPKVLPTDDGLLRDWRGLANEASIAGENLPLLANCPDATGYIISHMQKQTKCMFVDLHKMLEKLDRWDILSDAEQFFKNDAKQYLDTKGKSLNKAIAIDDCKESEILTVDDLYRYKDGLENMHYDAFLLYAEEDYDFAKKIVDFLENTSQLKLCIKDRNLMPGLTFTHDAIIQLISERCNRLIVVLSPSFLVSKENYFFLTYAQAIGIGKSDKGLRKIIPCMYKRCELPHQLRYMFVLDYNRAGFYDFWGKLRDSVKIIQNNDATKLNTSQSDVQHKKNLQVQTNNQIMKLDKQETQENQENQFLEEDEALSLPSVSHLEDLELGKVKKKNSKKKYISVCKKKLQSLLLKS